MFTAAHLIAAASLAMLGAVLSLQIITLWPEGTDFGSFVFVNLALGAVVGWKVMGKRAGRGTVPAINNGLTGVAMLVLWGLFIQGCYEMVRLAMRHRFDGPFEALIAVFELMADFALKIADPMIALTALIGAVLSGLATEAASRLWA